MGTMPRLKVLFVTSECMPLAKTGGLGDVAGTLPCELTRRGHDVRVVMPRYRMTKSFPARPLATPLAVPNGSGESWAAIWEGKLTADVPVYLVEHDVLYDREGIYGDAHGEFGDNARRYAFLSRAGLQIRRSLPFEPDVIHVHDWQTGLVPAYARASGESVPTVLTIHNLGYQGRFQAAELATVGIDADQSHDLGLEYHGDINLLKAGLTCATCLSTVSPTYAQEIQTSEGGAGLDGVLRDRAADLFGILNGIDEQTWDPSADPLLPARYDVDHLDGKAACKRALQVRLGLVPRPDVPLVGLVSRFVEQKGIDVFAAALDHLLPLDLQFAVLGSGEPWAEQLFARLSETTDRFRAQLGFDEGLAHLIEAGADLFVMPSRYEPCGLNQMYSQRYGTLPVVRAVGGLRDTVEHDHTGFVFEALAGEALAGAVAYASDTYRSSSVHFAQMQRAAMAKRMGWDHVAVQYEALYRLAVARQRGPH